MLTILIFPYPEEIIYSWLSRLNRILGCATNVQKSIDIFGVRNAKPRVLYPINLDYLTSNTPEEVELNSDSLIENHTIFPLFKPFLNKERAERAFSHMKGGDSRRLGMEIGINSGDFFERKVDTVKICPLCFEEDLNSNYSPYLRRKHQLPGNLICSKHHVYLNEYEIPVSLSQQEFYNIADIESKEIIYIEDHLKPYFLQLSKAIDAVFDGELSKYDINKINSIYRYKLKEKAYLSYHRVDGGKLISDFNKYYPKEFLEKLESRDVENIRENWIRKLFDKTFSFTQPIRHLLFIGFLFEDIYELKKLGEEGFSPFGEAPWVCLNSVCPCFEKEVVTDMRIEHRISTKELIGIFKCDRCGFEYRRVGADKNKSDKYRYDRVDDYGHLWKSEFRDRILNSGMSLVEVSKVMNCSMKKIYNELKKIESDDELKESNSVSIKVDTERLNNYKEKLLAFMSENPNCNRAGIQKMMPKQYMLIYLYDRSWLEENFPKPFKDGRKNPTNKIDWNKKDEETSKKVEAAVREILSYESPVRITKTHIARKMGFIRIIESKTLNKLPKTKETLDRLCETFEDFKKRKAKFEE